MFDPETTLTLLQHGDSAYPAGGFAFSWGTEGLAADGFLAGATDLDDLLADHLRLRWNGMDRVFLRRAWAGADPGATDLTGVADTDRLVEAMTLSSEMREGSRRAGRALLGVSARQGGALSAAYRALLPGDARLGHLPPVQALVWRDAGLDLDAAELLSAWTLATGIVSAAVRLGCLGHVEAQRCLRRARGVIAGLLARPVDDAVEPWSFTPMIDIAVSRGLCRDLRMFST